MQDTYRTIHFPASYHSYIKAKYASNDAVRRLEDDYGCAKATLRGQLSKIQEDLLDQLEVQFSALRKNTAEYGYCAGLCFGFGYIRQKNTENPKSDECNRLYEQLYNSVPQRLQYCIATIGCTWDQRVYSASLDGFALGKHHAQQVLFRVAK